MTDKSISHPDYEAGYFDALKGVIRADMSYAYRAGFEAGTFAREAFLKAGLSEDGRGGFKFEAKL
jgi:hypothetical protein